MSRRNIAVIVLTGLVLGGGAVAWAESGLTGPSKGTGAASPADRESKRGAVRACIEKAGEDATARRACLDGAGGHKERGHLSPLGKAVHGTLLVPGEAGNWDTVTFDRGTVADATDQSKIVLDRPDGQKVTLALTSDTRYRGVAGAGDIQMGKPAIAVSKDGSVTVVMQKDPDHQPRPGGGNNGDTPGVPKD